MKRRIWIKRRDSVRQRYWVGRKLKNYGSFTKASHCDCGYEFAEGIIRCPYCVAKKKGVKAKKELITESQAPRLAGHSRMLFAGTAEDFVEMSEKALEKKKKNYGSKVIETPEMKRRRERRGFDEIVEIDAKTFAKRFRRDQGTPLEWSSERLKSAREREEVDSYPQITVSESTGKVDVNDGRHRLAVAAEKGEKIKVAIRGEQESKLLTALWPRQPKPVLPFELTHDIRHENDSDRVARRQSIANDLMSRGWSLISAAQEAFDMEEKEEKERNKKLFDIIK